MRPSGLDVAASTLASSARAWRGTLARPAGRPPEALLELYDCEGDPEGRPVREALTELDLDALVRPCPEGGTRHRREMEGRGGTRLPFLVDPNTRDALSGSGAILGHLYRTYAGREPPRPLLGGVADALGDRIASWSRGGAGRRRRPSRAPERPLELFSFESSPYSRRVRERLCELELPYVLRSTGKARAADLGPPWVRRALFPSAPVTGRNRERLHALTGRLQVPYLVDPDTGEAMFESDAILAYLERRYGAS